jgi:hypothetical protein
MDSPLARTKQTGMLSCGGSQMVVCSYASGHAPHNLGWGAALLLHAPATTSTAATELTPGCVSSRLLQIACCGIMVASL